MRPDYRGHQVPCSRHRLDISAGLSGISPSAVHPKLAPRASSSRELSASCRVLRQPICPASLEKSCDQTDRLQSASHGVLVPHRGTSWRRLPFPGESQPQGHVPSAAFLTPSTVCSATNLCGLVSSRSHVQGLPSRGLSLTAEPYRVSPADSCPRVVERNRLRLPAPAIPPSPSGPCSPRSVRCRWGLLTLADPRPSWASPPPGISLRTPQQRFHATSARDLHCDEPTAAGPRRFAGARLGFPVSRLPTRSRFLT